MFISEATVFLILATMVFMVGDKGTRLRWLVWPVVVLLEIQVSCCSRFCPPFETVRFAFGSDLILLSLFY